MLNCKYEIQLINDEKSKMVYMNKISESITIVLALIEILSKVVTNYKDINAHYPREKTKFKLTISTDEL